MRTRLTLDDDLAAKLEVAMQARGESLEETINHFLRLGLNVHEHPKGMPRFVVRARDLNPRPGFDFDQASSL